MSPATRIIFFKEGWAERGASVAQLVALAKRDIGGRRRASKTRDVKTRGVKCGGDANLFPPRPHGDGTQITCRQNARTHATHAAFGTVLVAVLGRPIGIASIDLILVIITRVSIVGSSLLAQEDHPPRGCCQRRPSRRNQYGPLHFESTPSLSLSPLDGLMRVGARPAYGIQSETRTTERGWRPRHAGHPRTQPARHRHVLLARAYVSRVKCANTHVARARDISA